jgi:hypothetical protein
MADSIWRGKYSTLKEYYKNEYPEEYFELDAFQLEVDPDETVDEMSAYDADKQRLEYRRCMASFPYFATKYVKILHPKKGLVPFILYKYQKRVLGFYDKHRFNIISKFRQGGLTSLTELWGLWLCLFKLDQQILFSSKTDSEAITAGEIVNTAEKYMPTWMKPNKQDGKWNDHQKHFPETGGKMVFGTPERARGLAITYLILDEAAFIPEMERHWKSLYPTLSLGGNCIVISTVNGLGNWYEETFHAAQAGKNKFHVIELDYWEHPDYNDPLWVKEQKAQLQEKGWLQEVLRKFLGSGNTYIPSDNLESLLKSTKERIPKKRLYRQLTNKFITSSEEDAWEAEGAMWVWQEPLDGHEYIMGVDCADGGGDECDNSCFQIFDINTLEQVAEFYSNKVLSHKFAELITAVGATYNHALVVVENNVGGAVINNLEHKYYYDNLFYDISSKRSKVGIKLSSINRPVVLESLQNRIINGSIKINSKRLVKELTTFIYNGAKVQAIKGKHDDAILAAALAMYVRDTILRDVPVGAQLTKEQEAPLKSVSYEEIKRELMELVNEEMGKDNFDPLQLTAEEETSLGMAYSFRRKNEKILSEFGW